MQHGKTSKHFVSGRSSNTEKVSFFKLQYDPIMFYFSVMIVTEYVEDGDLLKFLRKCKFDKDSVKLDEKSLCKADLFSFTFQIANGMQYLERVPVRCNHNEGFLPIVNMQH